jgi:hypothetical protein
MTGNGDNINFSEFAALASLRTIFFCIYMVLGVSSFECQQGMWSIGDWGSRLLGVFRELGCVSFSADEAGRVRRA